eukprot:CAMPEP_0198313016 /NCGR_PEP_ID=MMETSP1450-20131203/4174_1 /TAXON_ID=753684 ORGANISM="Madagascaria erythrocladiodes, Strain CCMP3234" /NCGR_SAMPLE_ID=MMETSP1450 /ASSEMBLY_ACC=CAM_ASM_001115 /LENGTH=183 /DNA_ID=CAMNT_0044015985 /DNA_START=1 /DNA_END=549 /DNA_ORIENTATION=-
MRKNAGPWEKWSCLDALGLHKLQVKIAIRGADLLAVGGEMIYSTCSLNPVEDEAVVAELLRRADGALQLVDVSDRLPQLRRCSGVPTWHVVRSDRSGSIVREWGDFTDLERSRQWESVLPRADCRDMHLERCLRVMPHHGDTGGFFVAVLRKERPIVWREFESSDERRKRERAAAAANERRAA